MELTIAFSTSDGEHLINEHAGMAKHFDVYRFTDEGGEFVERRPNSKYGGDETAKHGDPKKARASLDALAGIDVWVNRKFGPNINRLLKKLLCVVVRTARIEDAVAIVSDNIERIADEHAKGEERKHIVLSGED